MSTSPTPPGYTEAGSHEPDLPGLEIGMLGVFTGVGWVVQQQQPVRSVSTTAFIFGLVLTVVIVEGLHEVVHLAVLRMQRINAEIHWSALSVIPTDQFVERRAVIIATAAPGVILSVCFVSAYLIAPNGPIAILFGLAVAVNGALSVLDIAVLYFQLRTEQGALYSFEMASGELEQIRVFTPAPD